MKDLLEKHKKTTISPTINQIQEAHMPGLTRWHRDAPDKPMRLPVEQETALDIASRHLIGAHCTALIEVSLLSHPSMNGRGVFLTAIPSYGF